MKNRMYNKVIVHIEVIRPEDNQPLNSDRAKERPTG